MPIEVKKDGEGFLAKICGRDNLYAFGFTKKEALKELGNVLKMITDYKLDHIKVQA